MKYLRIIVSLTIVGFFSLSVWAKDIEGVKIYPEGSISEPVAQMQMSFPETMIRKEAFAVTCSPEVQGFSSWADNDSKWTYSFKGSDEYENPRLPGGASCQVQQIEELRSVQGKVWKVGELNYTVSVAGPRVVAVIPAPDFQNEIRDKQPVVMLIFDGDIDRERFFSEQSNYLSYLSGNAPAEKMFLTPLPQQKIKEIYEHFSQNEYLYGTKYESRNWIFVTINRQLIPGSEVALRIDKTVSAYAGAQVFNESFSKKLKVRGNFKAEVVCASSTTSGTPCLPKNVIDLRFNSKVKWADVSSSYIEYIPFQSADGKTLRAHPVVEQSENDGWLESTLNVLTTAIPSLSRFSGKLVESIRFDVDIEPESFAQIVVSNNLKDIEGRPLSNSSHQFKVKVGSRTEMIRLPPPLSIFERGNNKNLSMPLALVNLNQKITIRKTGRKNSEWKPTTDVTQIISLINAYDKRGEYRSSKNYLSPLANGPSTEVTMTLKGEKNRATFLQVPFSPDKNGNLVGVYALEVSSPTYEEARRIGEGQYYNPPYTLAQVTDLSVHIKKGRTRTVLWVTELSSSLPVAHTQLELYNCLGQKVLTTNSDQNGLASFVNQEWASSCPQNTYSAYSDPAEFYVVARKQDDFSFTHSSWTSSRSWAFSSEGVEYFYNKVSDSSPHFHAVVGVNLVKPGQTVPVEIIARWPQANGFTDVPDSVLPSRARIVSYDDHKVFYDFDLLWNSDRTHFSWTPPKDSSVKLGRYDIQLYGRNDEDEIRVDTEGGIEVAEFKVPLMSGNLTLPLHPLVKPNSLPVGGWVRYANGVGAQDLSVELSYYFEPTFVRFKDFPEFTFGKGIARLDSQENTSKELPDRDRPETISTIKTDKNGALTKDLALEALSDGRLLGEVLSKIDRPQSLVTRLRYQDQTGEYQTLSQGKVIYNSHSFVGTRLVSGTQKEAHVQVAVVDVNQKNLSLTSRLDFSLFTIESTVIGEEVYGGMIKNTVERELKASVYDKAGCHLQKGLVSCRLESLKNGSYVFQVSDNNSGQSSHVFFKVDPQGRVYGEDDYYYGIDEENKNQLTLALDKPIYKDGEKAVVSFSSPFKACSALVSIERSDVIESFVSNQACQNGFVEVPVKASLAPNGFVSVYLVSGRVSSSSQFHQDLGLGELDLGRPTYKLGFANMKVDWSHFMAKVEVKTNKEKYEPREEVKVEVSVKAEEGALGNARVTLIALEEKILQLKKNETYNVLDAMMQMRDHEVVTITPLERIESVTANDGAEYALGDKRKGGDEGGDGSARGEFKRQIFDSLVTFQTDIPVVNGVARAQFKANDNLTRFKVFAIVTSTQHKFGWGEGSYQAEKETQSYSNISSIAYTGDKIPLRVNLQNNTSSDQGYRTEVTMKVHDASGEMKSSRNLSQSVRVSKGQSLTVEVGELIIPEEARKIEYEVRVYDSQGNLVDQLAPEPQLVYPSVPLALHYSYLHQVDNSGKLQIQLQKEEDALSDQGEIRTALSSSLVKGSEEQLNQQIDQNEFSHFLIESRIYGALLKSSLKDSRLLKEALTSLVGQVDDNGFVKIYPQALRGDLWVTASIINILQSRPWALKQVPSAVLSLWKDGVRSVLNKTVDPKYVGLIPSHWMQAQAVMGVAAFAFGDKSLENLARDVAEELIAHVETGALGSEDQINKWGNLRLVDFWLLEVFTQPEKALSSPRFQLLTQGSRLVYTGNQAQLVGKTEFIWDFLYSDTTKETAKLLFGLSRLNGDSNLARALSLGLVGDGGQTTYGLPTIAWIATALREFGASFEKQEVTGSTVLELVEEKQSQRVDWSPGVPTESLVVPWKSQQESIVVRHLGFGLPWVSVQGLTAVPLASSRGQGIDVEKELRNVTSPSAPHFQAGDIVEVTLKINTPSRLIHMALSDPIPSGSNIVGEAYGSFSTGEKSYRGYKFYFEALYPGMTVVRYQYQLNSPGEFKLPPTRAEGIYMPSVFGETPNALMSVR